MRTLKLKLVRVGVRVNKSNNVIQYKSFDPCMMSSRLLAAVAVLCLIVAIQNNNGCGGVVGVRAMMEEDRLNEYHKR